MPQVTLESARLRLRPRTLADVEACVAMDCDPAMHRFLYPEGITDPEAHDRHLRVRVAEDWPKIGLNAHGTAYHYGQNLSFYNLSRAEYDARPDG